MLTRIALVSPPGSGLDRVRNALLNPLKYTVREFLSMHAIQQGLVEFRTEVLILRLAVFSERDFQRLRLLEKQLPGVSTVVLAQEMGSTVRPQVAQWIQNGLRVHLLEEARETNDLGSVIDKLRKGEASPLRLHPRVRRSDDAFILDQAGQTHRVSFLDFAQMGARVVVHSMKRFEKKESVQLHYSSTSEPGRTKRVEARIAWVTGGTIKNHQAGIRFIAAY